MDHAVIAIETSTREGSVALWAGGRTVFEETFYADRSHNSAIFEPLGKVLELAGEFEIGLVVAGTGPGSYTGARVGIAAGQGVAMARQVELRGVASACAAELDTEDYALVGDARRGAFFWLQVEGRKLVGEVEVLTGREALDAKVGASGLDTVTFDAGLEGFTRSRPVARNLVVAALAGQGACGEAVPIEPIYLGAPFVTTPKRRGGAGGIR